MIRYSHTASPSPSETVATGAPESESQTTLQRRHKYVRNITSCCCQILPCVLTPVRMLSTCHLLNSTAKHPEQPEHCFTNNHIMNRYESYRVCMCCEFVGCPPKSRSRPQRQTWQTFLPSAGRPFPPSAPPTRRPAVACQARSCSAP